MSSPLSSTQSLPPPVQHTVGHPEDFTNVTTLRWRGVATHPRYVEDADYRRLRAALRDDVGALEHEALKRLSWVVGPAVERRSGKRPRPRHNAPHPRYANEWGYRELRAALREDLCRLSYEVLAGLSWRVAEEGSSLAVR
jgi:hypothetical protein